MSTENIHNGSNEENNTSQDIDNTASANTKRVINWRRVGSYAATAAVSFALTAGAFYGARALKNRHGSTDVPSAE